MIKLYGYELKRLILNKFFLALLLVTVVYSQQLLGGEIILGIAYTAPFSGWSYGTFLAWISPMLLVTLLFFITYLYSGKEKMVRVLTLTTSINPIYYGMLKCLAMLTGFVLILMITIGGSFIFYAKNFNFYDFSAFVIPIVITIIPSLLFVMGLGMSAGRIHPSLIYGLMLLMLLMGKISLPYSFDLLGGAFFQNFPLTLPSGPFGEPDFIIPTALVIGKLVFSVAGIVLIGIGLNDFKKKNNI